MRNLIKHKIFISAFLLTYFLFFGITVFLLELKKEGVGIIGHTEYGFPFGYYYSHCWGGHYLWCGLIGNILFATVLSIAIGLASTHFWLKFLLPLWQEISSPEFRSKWYI